MSFTQQFKLPLTTSPFIMNLHLLNSWENFILMFILPFSIISSIITTKESYLRKKMVQLLIDYKTSNISCKMH